MQRSLWKEDSIRMLSLVEDERNVVSPGNQDRKSHTKKEFLGKSVVALKITPERLIKCGRMLCINEQAGMSTAFSAVTCS